MNEKNLAYLKDNLKYMGFGEHLNEALQTSIAEDKKEFELTLDTEIDRQPFSATLFFRRPENSDVYFFNKWEAFLKNGAGKMQHTFYLHKGRGVTLKEGFNLLEGRAVYKELSNKEGQKYQAWLQLDKREMDINGNYKMSQYNQNYGYLLEKVLAPLPIKELTDQEQRDALFRSLYKGNLQVVSFEQNEMVEKLFIAANPQYKSLTVYDQNGAKIPLKTLEKRFGFVLNTARMDDVNILGKAREKVNNKEIGDDSERGLASQKVEKKEQKESKSEGLQLQKDASNGLLDKKRSSTQKGLHL